MRGRKHLTSGYLLWRLKVWRALHPAKHRWMPTDLWWKLQPELRLYLMTNPTWNMPNFRIREDDTEALNSTTWTLALNTDATIAADTTFRVRYEVEETATADPAANQAYTLYYNYNSGTATGQVTTTSSYVKAVNSGQFTDGDATTNILSGSSRTFIAGEGSTDATTANILAMSNSHSELEFSLQLVGTDVSATDTVVLEFRESDGTTISGTMPTITVASGATSATATPQPVTVATSAPQAGRSGSTVRVPVPVSVATSSPQATASGGTDATTTPEPVVVTVSIPQASGVAGDATVTPEPVTVTTTIPQADGSGTSVVTVDFGAGDYWQGSELPPSHRRVRYW